MQVFKQKTRSAPGLAFAALCTLSLAQASDPIETCRTQSATDAARIACLETALRALTDDQTGDGDASGAAPADGGKTSELAAGAPQPDGLGAEQILNREKRFDQDAQTELVAARIVEHATDGRGRVTVTLDNGQVWRQTQSANRKIRLSNKRSYDVEIKPGFMSGYRMTIKQTNASLRVERLK